jgi:GR25 family glycosyltransferase involved in LPS biosynthesis
MITAYIITDPHSTLSTSLAAETIDKLEQHNWSYKIWPAVNGFKLTADDWRELGIQLLPRGKTPGRPGALGCIHSHFRLWQHCQKINEPIAVLEHDALAQASFPQDLDLEQGIWKLCAAGALRHNDITGTWSRGSWAYTLTPQQAQSLIAFAREHGVQALDKQIGSNAVAWSSLGWDLFVHNPRPVLSSTVIKVYLA